MNESAKQTTSFRLCVGSFEYVNINIHLNVHSSLLKCLLFAFLGLLSLLHLFVLLPLKASVLLVDHSSL